jgi:hypothetical protein
MTGPGRYLVTVLMVSVIAACDDITGTGGSVDGTPVSAWVLESGPDYDLYALSGSGPGSVYAAGAAGVILHYDGSGWVDVGPPSQPFVPIRRAVYSPAPGEFFTADNYQDVLWHCDDSGCRETRAADIPATALNIEAIWGTSENNVYAAGRGPDILHFDGTSWSAIQGVNPGHVGSIWGFPSGEVFAAGEDGVVHYDGVTWATTPFAIQLQGIWGSSPADVYAVGRDGVHHFDGTQWREVALGVTFLPGLSVQTTAVWGSSSTDVFVVGNTDGGSDVESRGLVLHYDGTGWSSMSIDALASPLQAVWGSGPSDVWAAGDRGMLLHYDGSEWRTVREGLGHKLTGVDGLSDSDLFVVGEHTVLHRSGNEWSRLALVGDQANARFADVSLVALTPHMVGSGGLFYFNGWELRSIDAPYYVRSYAEAVWGSDAGEILVVGYGVHRYQNGSWSSVLPDHRIRDVWADTRSDMYAVGQRWDTDTYRGSILHFDGEDWTPFEISRMRYSASGVWGSSGSDVFVVGENGVILHWNGDVWEEMESGTYEHLVAVRGSAHDNVYAVGARGTVLRYDGSSWSPVDLPFRFRGAFNDVWVREGHDVVVVGDAGTIVRGVR